MKASAHIETRRMPAQIKRACYLLSIISVGLEALGSGMHDLMKRACARLTPGAAMLCRTMCTRSQRASCRCCQWRRMFTQRCQRRLQSRGRAWHTLLQSR